MATLPTLIKQAEQELERLQKEIVILQQQDAALAQDILRLEAEMARSFTDAEKADDPQQLGMALRFNTMQAEKITALNQQKTDIHTTLNSLNEALRGKFAEQKRYEILHERQITAARAERLKKQQAELDDLAQRGGAEKL